jgi:hypothetical protein
MELNEQQLEQFKDACHKAWSYISSDIPEKCSRDEVVELVLDADRIRSHGKPRKMDVSEWIKIYDEVFEPWVKANYNKQTFKDVMKQIFTKAWY